MHGQQSIKKKNKRVCFTVWVLEGI